MEEKNNNRKYNYGVPIPLDEIPIEECETALNDFSDG